MCFRKLWVTSHVICGHLTAHSDPSLYYSISASVHFEPLRVKWAVSLEWPKKSIKALRPHRMEWIVTRLEETREAIKQVHSRDLSLHSDSYWVFFLIKKKYTFISPTVGNKSALHSLKPRYCLLTLNSIKFSFSILQILAWTISTTQLKIQDSKNNTQNCKSLALCPLIFS